MDIASIIQTIAVFALPVLLAITLSEAAQGYAAQYFGDTTPAQMGRLSLNPIKHISPVGTLLVPLLVYLLSGGKLLFGYAKGMPVDWQQLRNPRRDMIWIALAGPGSQLAQALFWSVLLITLLHLGVTEPFFLRMCQAGILINAILFAIAMLPLPPMAGGRVLCSILPSGPALALARLERWSLFIVLGLFVSGLLSQYWMLPIMRLFIQVLALLLAPLGPLPPSPSLS